MLIDLCYWLFHSWFLPLVCGYTKRPCTFSFPASMIRSDNLEYFSLWVFVHNHTTSCLCSGPKGRNMWQLNVTNDIWHVLVWQSTCNNQYLTCDKCLSCNNRHLPSDNEHTTVAICQLHQRQCGAGWKCNDNEYYYCTKGPQRNILGRLVEALWINHINLCVTKS